MTSYMLILRDGSQVEAIKNNGVFKTDTGEIYTLLDTRSFVNFDHITHDQYEFEELHRTFTLRADYSKYDSLMYRSTLTGAAYKTWRIAKGYSIDDPEYKANSRESTVMPSPIYPVNHGKWVGD